MLFRSNAPQPTGNYNAPSGGNPSGTYNSPQPTGSYNAPQPTGSYNAPSGGNPSGTYNAPQPTGNYNAPQPTGTYNVSQPGNPGQPTNVLGVYFPGGNAGSLAPYVSETVTNYWDYPDNATYPVTVPTGGQIVVKIE